MKKIYFGIVFLALIAVSCEKEDSIPTRFTPNPSGNTNVKFLMLSPDAPQVNLFANGIKTTGVAPTSAGVVQGMVFPSVFPSIVGYVTIPSGTLNIETRKAEDGSVLLSTSETFDAGKFYTYVIMDSVNSLTTVAVEDDLSVPNPANPYIRLANFTSDTSTLRFEIRQTTGGTYPYTVVSTDDVSFKSVTAFEELTTGTTYRIYLLNPARNNQKLDSISAFTPVIGRKYTIYSRGVFGLTGTNAKRPIITSYTNL